MSGCHCTGACRVTGVCPTLGRIAVNVLNYTPVVHTHAAQVPLVHHVGVETMGCFNRNEVRQRLVLMWGELLAGGHIDGDDMAALCKLLGFNADDIETEADRRVNEPEDDFDD